jgi:thiol-disulfide isomerase/thioredoxin
MAPLAGAEELATTDPYWSLVHDEAVLDELKLTNEQRSAFRKVLDPLDVACFSLRNKSAEAAAAGFAKAAAEARAELGKVLKPLQAQRLEQIALRSQGAGVLVREDVAKKLKLKDEQRTKIRQAIAEVREAREKLQRDLRAAKLETAAAQKQWNELNNKERDAVNAALTNEQKQSLVALLGKEFDSSRLGATVFKTPQLVGDSEAWLNTSPLADQDLRGRVVVVHFFAFGCSNCIHNYPTYREWQSALSGKNVTIVGIHTPETKAEHNVETLKSKLKAEELNFPVIVDNAKANWDAWGNSMWPSVYVLDKQGYMRAFWAGELRWQGATGDKQMLEKIERLLQES